MVEQQQEDPLNKRTSNSVYTRRNFCFFASPFMRPLRSGCLHGANEYTRTAPSQGKTGRSRWRCCSIFPGSRCSDLRAHFIQRRHAIFFYISSRALIYILNYLLFIASYSSSIKLERQVIFITTGFLLFQPLFVCLLRRVLINSPPPS